MPDTPSIVLLLINKRVLFRTSVRCVLFFFFFLWGVGWGVKKWISNEAMNPRYDPYNQKTNITWAHNFPCGSAADLACGAKFISHLLVFKLHFHLHIPMNPQVLSTYQPFLPKCWLKIECIVMFNTFEHRHGCKFSNLQPFFSE